MIEADYSAALTLLLRYPTPLHPHGPSSFVGDALYLRDNTLQDGGPNIVFKYSKKQPALPSEVVTNPNPFIRRFSRKSWRVRRRQKEDSSKSTSPRMSAAKFLQDQGGIEGIIQEAARGVYSRGEKWGVARALRGAVQGLQSGNNSPRRLPDGLRWSLDQGKNVTDDSSRLTTKLHEIEQRNKALAKLLDNAMEDLWVQQKDFTKDQAEAAADALSLAIAKVQFVQVYLENSTMPFPTESPVEEVIAKVESASSPGMKADDNVDDTNLASLPAANPDPIPDRVASPVKTDVTASGGPRVEITAAAPPSPTKSADTKPKRSDSTDVAGEFPFHQPRPSLAQSSFSWMLGEDQRRSSFVLASPFPSGRRNARGKAGFLFGDDKIDGNKGSHGSHAPKGKETREEEDEEISLGELKTGSDGAGY